MCQMFMINFRIVEALHITKKIEKTQKYCKIFENVDFDRIAPPYNIFGKYFVLIFVISAPKHIEIANGIKFKDEIYK